MFAHEAVWHAVFGKARKLVVNPESGNIAFGDALSGSVGSSTLKSALEKMISVYVLNKWRRRNDKVPSNPKFQLQDPLENNHEGVSLWMAFTKSGAERDKNINIVLR